MSTHPNVILALALMPDGTTRASLRALRAEAGHADDAVDPSFVIEGQSYRALVMESDYDEDFQISAEEGEIVLYDLVTYGYGETIAWDDLTARADALEAWAVEHALRYGFTWRVFVTANYW